MASAGPRGHGPAAHGHSPNISHSAASTAPANAHRSQCCAPDRAARSLPAGDDHERYVWLVTLLRDAGYRPASREPLPGAGVGQVQAVTIRDTVSFHRGWEQFDADGNPRDPDGVGAAAKTLLDQLAWWAWALREARERRPYGA